MPTVYGAVDLAKNELRNAVVQNLGSAPSSPVKFQIYGNSADNNLYYYDGTAWVSCRSAGALTPATTSTTSSPADAALPGVSTNYSREDHRHGRESFGVVSAETTFGSASNNGGAGTPSRSDHVHGNPVHDSTAHSAVLLNSLAVPNNALNLNNQNISNLLAPVNNQDAATKLYVDNMYQGLSWKDTCKAATTANITLSGQQTVDAISLVNGDRCLVKNQTLPQENGIYVVAVGAWTRATDADSNTEIPNMTLFVESGTVNADTAWMCTANAPVTVGTTSLPFVQFGAGATYTAGAGLTLTGNVIDVVTGDTSLVVNADEIHVNTGVIATVASVTAAVTGMAKKFAAALTGTASPETVTHNLNTRDIALTVYNGATPYTAVEVDWDATTVNTAVIRYNPNLGAGYRVVCVG